MITLPTSPAPNGMDAQLLDYGITQRGSASLRVNRAGGRYAIAFSYPPMTPENARRFIGRLQRAKTEGLEIRLPLLVPQGIPGAPLVDGAGQSGKTLLVRGLTAGYVAKEGFWLTISEADGTAYSHIVVETAVAGATGLATLQVEPPLRAPFPDAAVIELARPFVQGFIDGDSFGWAIPVDRLVSVQFALEEYQ